MIIVGICFILFQISNTAKCHNYSYVSAQWMNEDVVLYVARSLVIHATIITCTFLANIRVRIVRPCTQEVTRCCCTCAQNIRQLLSNEIVDFEFGAIF